MRRRCRFAATWLALGVFAAPLLAAESDRTLEQFRPKTLGKLELKVRPSLAAIRSDAPFSIELDLESTFADVIQGDLELTFVDDHQVRLRLETGPIAVPNGQKSFRLFLPAMAANEDRTSFEVHAVFYGPREPLDLGTHDLVVPLRGQRQFVMAAAGFEDATVSQFTRHLALDAFRPPEASRASLLTLPVQLDLHAIPIDPVGLYSYDLLVFAGEYFSRLSARQLDTITEWVETGGGVVVVPTGVLTAAHTEFLERLAGRDAKGPHFVVDQFGRLPARPPGGKDWLIACRYGYGRALILQALPAVASDGSLANVSAAQWKRAVCFLWNVRPKQTTAILGQGNWHQPDGPPTADELLQAAASQHLQRRWSDARRPSRSTFLDNDARGPLHPEAFAQGDALRALLFPEEVRVVPFRVVATILTLFLLAIAPADYLVLGFFRRRRYTWFVFPALCLAFTIATVWVARYYTGTIDHRGALVIVDIGEQGRPLRTTRIEHIITAGTRPISTEVKNGLFARTDIQPLKADELAIPANRRSAGAADPDAAQSGGPLEYAGTLPSAFAVTRTSRQWTPSMDRVTTTGSPIALPPFPWSDIDSADVVTERGRTAVAERLRRIAPECEILFLAASQSEASTLGPGGRSRNWPAVLTGLSQRSDNRLFSLVSRISPNGAGDLEDLSVLDEAEPDSCVLHVAIKRGEDLLVVRRLLHPKRRFDLN